jgi:hypothetical protein
MGNPVITRLGKTQIWYKNWHSDLHVSKTLHKLNSFEKVATSYFNYGIYYQNSLFYNTFWYKQNLSYFSKHYVKDALLKKNIYYRKYFFSHKTLAIEHSYFIRIKTPEYFPLRLYIVSYNNWIILSIQWFKPFKGISKKINNKSKFFNKKWPLISSRDRLFTKNNRLKLLLFFLNSFLVVEKLKNSYNF